MIKKAMLIRLSCNIRISKNFYKYLSTQNAYKEKNDEKTHKEDNYMMKAWQLQDYNNNIEDAFAMYTTRIPIIRNKSDILVRVKASSVNPIDVKMCSGYGDALLDFVNYSNWFKDTRLTYDRFPITLGRDFSGNIVNTGRGVKEYKVGDKVWGVVSPFKQGAHAEYVLVSENEISHKPFNLSHVEAASVPYVALTSWSAISSFGGYNQNNSVNKRALIVGGTGGIGTFSIQLLKAWGAYVVATCSEDAKEWLKELTDVDECFDYRDNGNFEPYFGSFDMILDVSNPELSSGDQAFNSLVAKCLKKERGAKYLTLNPPLLRTLDEKGLLLGSMLSLCRAARDSVRTLSEGGRIRWAFFMSNQIALNRIRRMVERNELKPVIEKVYNFNELIKAYNKVHLGHSRGKSVIEFEN